MKHNKHILLPMTLALLSVTTSCEQEELSPTLPEGDFVEVRARIGSHKTRVAQPEDNVYVFEDGDKIHIVSWYDADPNVYSQRHKFENPEKPGTYLWWDDAVSTYSKSNDRWHTTPYLRWQNIDLDSNPNPHHCFLAWYPEDLVESNAVLTAIPVTVTGDIKEDDYMFARWFGQRPANDNVIDLGFIHLMARFDLHLNFGSQYSNVTDVVAKTEVETSGILDLLNFECDPVSGTTAWQTFTPVSFSNGNEWRGTTICIPQNGYGRKVVLSFKADGQQKELTYTHTKFMSLSDKVRTTLILEVGKDIVELVDVAVTDWETAPDIDGGEAVEWVNGFSETGEYEPAQLNASGYYEIANGGNLFWFAKHVNTVDRTASAVLTANIDLEGRPWTPIGSTGEANNNFRGVFDGQNYTIRGLNVEGGRAGLGFFGEVRTGTVKNFTIYGEVVVNTEVDYVGGVIGSICGLNGENDLERNGAVIQNITSYVNLTAKAHGIGMIGGFVGYANHQSLIEKCSWYGTFDAGEYRVDSGAGGFIGKIQENTSEVTIRNCAAYGTIKTNYAKNSFNNTPTIYMGGFLSFSNTGAKTTLENCLFAGKFERGANLTDEARLGAFGTLRSVNAIKNCYYLDHDGLEAVHSDSNLKPGSDNVEITAVTEDDLRNNTIATQLGTLWEQGENYPVIKK